MNTIYELLGRIKTDLESNNEIGIMVSGGFDSGVLLSIILCILQENNIHCNISAYTIDRSDGSATHARNIISILEKKFGISMNHHIVPRGNSSIPRQEILRGIHYALANPNIGKLFIADNLPPSFQIHPTISNPQRHPTTIKKISQPFITKTKDFIVELAIEFDMIDIMINSHTCTFTDNIRCNACWWCAERKWAFAVNNYKDPGNL